jgi:hypothetical protein
MCNPLPDVPRRPAIARLRGRHGGFQKLQEVDVAGEQLSPLGL